MNKSYILFTAGNGPQECALAVFGIQKKFIKFLDENNIGYQIEDTKKDKTKNSFEKILFNISSEDSTLIQPWLGTLKWSCQSPIRPSHKRKNWFIKCEEIKIGEKHIINSEDVVVQTYRASGPGGQHRNKVETAVRLIHEPSGLIVTASKAKSQIQNKKAAWALLAEKIQDRNQEIIKNFHSDQWLS